MIRSKRFALDSALPAFVVLASALFALTTGARASGGEDIQGTPDPNAPKTAHSPIYFPPSKAGYPGEWRDPRDVAPYLSFHEGRAAQGQQGTLSEPTTNQLLYDARYYALELTLAPTTHLLTGVVTMRAEIVGGPLTQIDVDLAANLTVSSVTSGGLPATFSRPGDLLQIDLDRAYDTGEVVELVMSYSGNPTGDSFAWDSFGGKAMIWTLSEPFGARTWWPCKDYPEDKADSVDVHVNAPTTMLTASNGVLRDSGDNGTTAFSWWHESHPIATYLVSIATHPYTLTTDWYHASPTDSTELRFYSFPSHASQNQQTEVKVKDMMGAFAGRYGPYPFADEKYGHAEFLWGGGMEHQTCSSMGFYGESVVAHELAHQWFGDDVTCKTFEHVWLNEGFATYSEALWEEQVGGHAAYLDDMLLNQYFGPGTIYVPPTEDFNRIFDGNLSYAKASWVLHMLRHITGDTAFFQILQTYRAQFSGQAATTEDFKGVAEAVSGLELDPFFTQWIYGEGAPIYSYTWTGTPNGGGYDVALHVDQLQSGQTFDLPLDVRVTTQSGVESFVVSSSLAAQDFVLSVGAQPTNVELDPDHWILRILFPPIPTPTFAKQLLLVNGVAWDTYGTEIRTAYADRAFSGNYAVDFWDYFPTPSGGYPSPLPAPLGHGAVPPEVLAQYRAVIWIGNNLGGDLDGWLQSPIYSYLKAGGDVLLLSRFGQDFLSEPFRNYLGVNWVDPTGQINDCVANQFGLTNIARTGVQNFCATFDATVTSPSVLLYKADLGYDPDLGIGVYNAPPGGGTYNPTGGRFIFLSGRPYRWNHAQLRTNVEFMLANYFGLLSTDVDGSAASLELGIEVPRPNPFAERTGLRFSLPRAEAVRLRVFDVTGRAVRELVQGTLAAGQHRVEWDGKDAKGAPSASGVYFVRLEAEGRSLERKLLRIR